MQIPRIINKNRFYYTEEKEFPIEHETRLTRTEAKRYVRKICRHFKQDPIALKFHGKRNRTNSGSSDQEARIISVSHKPSVLVVAHELAHIFTESGHTKRGLAMLEKIIVYSRKKNYWRG